MFPKAMVMAAALLLGGCKKTATIEGDLTLAMQSGEVRKGAVQTVFMLRNGDSVSQAVDAICRDWKGNAAQREARAKDMDAKANVFKRSAERAPMRAQVALLDSVDKYRQAAVAERQTQSAQDAIAERILAIVHAAADTQVQTDIDAHYRIENLPPGRYVVFAEWPSDEVFTFWAPVELKKGDEKKQDLDRATLANAKLRCQ